MLSDEQIRNSIKATVLRNAIEHNGKARADAVIGKIAASRPDLRSNLKGIIPEINKSIQEINALSLTQQKLLLKQISPEQVSEISLSSASLQTPPPPPLPPLANAAIGNVITRFPPEPNGYPHIGHAKAAIIDEEYAHMYKGKLILRFDDTNPLNEKLEYYEAFIDAIHWLEIKPDIIKNTSDDIELLYEYGKKLLLSGGAYVCTCSQQTVHDLRARGLDCDCRKVVEQTPELTDRFFGGFFDQNKAIIRLKGNMADPNTAMRDPTLFRIIQGHHPKLGNKYRIWPTYDFAAPIEDSLDGVTHAMRTKEYELRNTLYFAILDNLNLRKPQMIEFSRLEFDGIPVSKRKIKPLIEKGIIKSWDDPRLPTLIAMKRRGFVPEAIRRFVLSLGITLAETKPPFETLVAFNRRIIEPQSIRLFFVKDPVELRIQNASAKEVILKNHPNIEHGRRKVWVDNSVYIGREDALRLNVGDEIRLIELYNIRVVDIKTEDGKLTIICLWSGDDIKQDILKIQWVAKNDTVPYKIIVPREIYRGEQYNENSLEVWKGFCESFVSTLKTDTKVQFVRTGFCRIDETATAIYTHR